MLSHLWQKNLNALLIFYYFFLYVNNILTYILWAKYAHRYLKNAWHSNWRAIVLFMVCFCLGAWHSNLATDHSILLWRIRIEILIPFRFIIISCSPSHACSSFLTYIAVSLRKHAHPQKDLVHSIICLKCCVLHFGGILDSNKPFPFANIRWEGKSHFPGSFMFPLHAISGFYMLSDFSL